MRKIIVAVAALAIPAAVVFGLTKLTLDGAGAQNRKHRAGNPTFDQVARGGRALMYACARHAIQHKGALPPDMSALILVDEGPFAGADPVVKPALVPDDVNIVSLRAMTPAARAALLNKHTPFDYVGAGVNARDAAQANVIILVGRGCQTNARTESDEVDVKFVGYADGRTGWVKCAKWADVWQASQAARRAAGLPAATLP